MHAFGLRTWEFGKETRIQTKLSEIEAAFNLIMINDKVRFNQSLVLLKDMMGWSLDDVVTLSVNKQVWLIDHLMFTLCAH